MGKKNDQKGRSKGEGKHVRHYRQELESPAYRSLSCAGRALYTEIKLFYNGKNNGEVYLSVRKAAERLGVAPNTAKKALKELENRGFIKPHVAGSFSWKKRHATTWVLTEYYFNGLPTREYRHWHLEKQKPVLNPAPPVSVLDTESLASNQK